MFLFYLQIALFYNPNDFPMLNIVLDCSYSILFENAVCQLLTTGQMGILYSHIFNSGVECTIYSVGSSAKIIEITNETTAKNIEEV